MNPYIQNLNRIEFAVTFACTGHCKHCSQGDHREAGEHIDGETAAAFVNRICDQFQINSLMTFGGEPLLYLDEVCRIHRAAREKKIPKRQLITNGFFSRDEKRIEEAAGKLAESGVNEICLSVDAFHQESIPLEPVKKFAEFVKTTGISICTHPAWLVDREHENPYNKKTWEILNEFAGTGIGASEGNIIFPDGNAQKYLGEYFDPDKEYCSPYTEDPEDIRAICVSPNGDVLGGNIYREDILDIVEGYCPA